MLWLSIISTVPVLIFILTGFQGLALPWSVVLLLAATVALIAGFKNIQTYNRSLEAHLPSPISFPPMRPIFWRPKRGQGSGKSIKEVLVEYGPGGYSPSHTHAKSAIIYATVIEGSVRSQVNDGPVVTYRIGQNWTAMPGDHHRVSANASRARPAKILAVFVVDDMDAEFTIPDKR
jgi:quercetin dioxygenase-like cupin family protein